MTIQSDEVARLAARLRDLAILTRHSDPGSLACAPGLDLELALIEEAERR